MADDSKQYGDRVHGENDRDGKRSGRRPSEDRTRNGRSRYTPRTDGGRDDRPRRDDTGRRDDRTRRDDSARRDYRDSRGRSDSGRHERGSGRPGRYDERRPSDDRRPSRPGQSEREQRPFEPPIPAGITGKELAREIREELRGLSRETAERVSQHLVAAYLLEDSDSQAAQDHAKFAARIGGRIGGVRETYGIIAYRAGDFRTAVRELRTSLRITGRIDVLPLIADAERGMGRPERALDIAASDDASDLGVDAAIELMIVVAGAYADTGDVETALRTLEIPALRHKVDGRWQVRLWVAYADLLARAERQDEAKRWLTLAADTDTDGVTDAAARLGRPTPKPVDEAWSTDEEISVLDAFDDSQEEPAAIDATAGPDASDAEPEPEADEPETDGVGADEPEAETDEPEADEPYGDEEQPREGVLTAARASSPEDQQ